MSWGVILGWENRFALPVIKWCNTQCFLNPIISHNQISDDPTWERLKDPAKEVLAAVRESVECVRSLWAILIIIKPLIAWRGHTPISGFKTLQNENANWISCSNNSKIAAWKITCYAIHGIQANVGKHSNPATQIKNGSNEDKRFQFKINFSALLVHSCVFAYLYILCTRKLPFSEREKKEPGLPGAQLAWVRAFSAFTLFVWKVEEVFIFL